MADLRFLRVVLVASLLGVSAAPVWGQREVYDRYAARDGLTVAYVSDLRLDSALTVDVVLIHADDSAAWRQLREELHFGLDLDENGRPRVAFTMRDRHDPTLRPSPDDMDNCMLKITPPATEICIFFFKNPGQAMLLMHMLFKELREISRKHPASVANKQENDGR